MNWAAVSAITATISAIGAAVCAAFSLMVRVEVSRLREKITEYRMQDREDLRHWINGSFMRAATAQAKIDEMEHRLDNVEIRFSVR